MYRYINKLVLLLLLCYTEQAFSQSCALTVDRTNPVYCVGGEVTFTGANTPSANVLSYEFDYGNGTDSGSLSVRKHIYFVPGTYQTKLTVNLIGGTTCEDLGPIITINPLPVCKYVITSNDTLCFRNNLLCVLDESTPGAPSAAIVKRIFVLSSGYILEQNAPYPNTICYNNTNEVNGHIYSLTMEITDVNGCVSRLEKIDSVILAPQTQRPSFRFSGVSKCTNTEVTFTNTSLMDSSKYKSWRWDFGDGQFNTTQWNNLKHTYFPPGGAKPNLYTVDKYGCIDTAVRNPTDTIKFISVDPLLRLTTPSTQCFNLNRTLFQNFSANHLTETYTFRDMNDNILAVFNSDSGFNFVKCGDYKLNLKVKFSDSTCNVNKDTTIRIFGPDAVFHNDTVKPINSNQCEAHDTVRFVTPNPYLSCHSNNTGMKWLWDFNDQFAPPCTTDTRNNLNVSVNCRYSRDSIQVKHHYSTDGCYKVLLVMTDTVLNCTDRDSVTLALKAPDAGWDSTSVPIRPGLTHDQPSPYICPNTSVTFFFSQLLPECGYEKLWLNYDSACDADAWEIMDTVKVIDRIAHFYGTVCDTSTGWITVGVIVKNGVDQFGKECYDTAWYHKMLHLDVLKGDFEYIARPRVNCGPYVIDFIAKDTNQVGLEYAFWDFNLAGPSSVDDTVYQYMNGDSLIKRQTFTYPKGGRYPVFLALKTVNDCFASSQHAVFLGIYIDAAVPKTEVCVNDTFSLYGQVLYQNNNTPFWNDPARALANKERVWWNISDGKGFFYEGIQPSIKFTKPGSYKISAITQDSMGCRDTFDRFGPLFLPLNISVNEVKAKITLPFGAEQYCAPQIIQFKDSSAFVDSFGVYISPSPYPIDTTFWDFGDNTSPSFLLNPGHNYAINGTFEVKLVAISSAVGCRDTDIVQVNMNGPAPRFVIVGDTQGCAPFTVHLDNTTLKKIKLWTWVFNDSNFTQRTETDSVDVSFTYTKPGMYNIWLIGTDLVLNPSTGNTIPCSSVFPDTITNIPRRTVWVHETPPLDLVLEDSICPGQSVLFKVTGDTVYNAFRWNFGDGDTIVVNRPDTTATNVYDLPGTYDVKVIPKTLASGTCIDTATKTVHVQSVNADFEIDKEKSPLFAFTNKSSNNAVRYEWNFGQKGTATDVQSVLKDPTYNYGAELGEYKVCLIAYTAEDCWDSACQIIIRDTAYVTIPNVFTPDNNDGFNDAYDIDIEGYTQYHLAIYNRWGGKVFESRKDGVGNDGNNWNGKEQNEGLLCPSGVYYFVFTYKLITEDNPKTVNGTITLLRELK